MSAPATQQLRRLLQILPHVADGEEHALDALAERAGVDRHLLIRDLQALVQREEDIGGFVEGVQIYMDGRRRVSVVTPHFHRPMRLTRAELCALELGLAIARSTAPPDEAATIERALVRLRQAITRLPQDDRYDGIHHAELGAAGNPAHLAAVRDALRRRRVLELCYRGGSAQQASERRVRPYGLVYDTGTWYLVAHCERARALRIFRLDRVEGATVTDEPYRIPRGFSLDETIGAHGVFRAERPRTMRVRYSSRIARWIAEREGHALAADGSLTVDRPVADDEWAVRHVLQYGPDAEVLEPPELRRAVAVRLRAIAGA